MVSNAAQVAEIVAGFFLILVSATAGWPKKRFSKRFLGRSTSALRLTAQAHIDPLGACPPHEVAACLKGMPVRAMRRGLLDPLMRANLQQRHSQTLGGGSVNALSEVEKATREVAHLLDTGELKHGPVWQFVVRRIKHADLDRLTLDGLSLKIHPVIALSDHHNLIGLCERLAENVEGERRGQMNAASVRIRMRGAPRWAGSKGGNCRHGLRLGALSEL